MFSFIYFDDFWLLPTRFPTNFKRLGKLVYADYLINHGQSSYENRGSYPPKANLAMRWRTPHFGSYCQFMLSYCLLFCLSHKLRKALAVDHAVCRRLRPPRCKSVGRDQQTAACYSFDSVRPVHLSRCRLTVIRLLRPWEKFIGSYHVCIQSLLPCK
jgi:hypothetical protein